MIIRCDAQILFHITIHQLSYVRVNSTYSLHNKGMGSYYSNVSLISTKLLKIDTLLQYNETVSIGQPPSTTTFDLTNCRSSLYTCHYHFKLAFTSASFNISDIPNDLMHLLQIISSVVSMTCAPLNPPTILTCCKPSSNSFIHSPTCNTPSKLS